MTQDQKDAFLAELTELSRKHRIAIGGCGCCGSPWLFDLERKPTSEVAYDGDDGKYSFGEMNGELEWVKP